MFAASAAQVRPLPQVCAQGLVDLFQKQTMRSAPRVGDDDSGVVANGPPPDFDDQSAGPWLAPGQPAATEEALEAGELVLLIENADGGDTPLSATTAPVEMSAAAVSAAALAAAAAAATPSESARDDAVGGYPSTLEDEAITLPSGSQAVVSPWPVGTMLLSIGRILAGVGLLYLLAIRLNG